MSESDERMYLVDLGRIAYMAYRDGAGGSSLVDGSVLPTWEGQSQEIRECWRMAADAVRMWLDLHPKYEEGK